MHGCEWFALIDMSRNTIAAATLAASFGRSRSMQRCWAETLDTDSVYSKPSALAELLMDAWQGTLASVEFDILFL